MPNLIKRLVRIAKWFLGIIVGLLLILVLIPYLFPERVSREVKQLANQHIEGKLDFGKVRLSFFSHFPALTLSLYDFSLKGSAPFEKDTLIAGHELAFGIHLMDLLRSKVTVDQFFITKADIHVQVNEAGAANYNVYKSGSDTSKTSSDSSSARLEIEHIVIQDSKLVYDDRSIPIRIAAEGLNYSGKGDLSKAIFDLHTSIDIANFDLNYDGTDYMKDKRVRGNLITQINTNSLAFIFQENKLRINKLPVEFNGKFEFLKNGYAMDFSLKSLETDLEDVLTALPPAYKQWLEDTRVKGYVDMNASLKGLYSTADNKAPDLAFNLKVRDGYIRYADAPMPLSKLFVNLETALPSLNTDSFRVQLDSISFQLEKDYFGGRIKTIGIDNPFVDMRIRSNMDLGNWDKALGIQQFDVSGQLKLAIDAQGQFMRRPDYKKIHPDTIITSIPAFNAVAVLENGSFHYNALPGKVEQIQLNLAVNCADSLYQHTRIALNNLSVKAGKNYLKAKAVIGNLAETPVDASLDAQIQLQELQQFYPLEQIQLKGKLQANGLVKGNYQPEKKQFPLTTLEAKLTDGWIKTPYYPNPIEQIQVITKVACPTTNTKDLSIDIPTASMLFEQSPFQLKASFADLTDIRYLLDANGVLNIGKIYQVFAIKGYDVNGTVSADVHLQGRQSDVLKKRYTQLNNSGSIRVKELDLRTDLYPMPLHIRNGVFSFVQDKLRFDAFQADYGQSDIQLNGSVSNLFAYVLDQGALKGQLNFTSNKLLLDELMAYQGDTTATQTESTGVIMLPKNLELQLNALVKKASIQDIPLAQIKGAVLLKNGILQMKDAGFIMAGGQTTMNASYTPVTPLSANFDYHIQTADLDVQQAYKDIGLLREMIPAAKKAQGLISLDYQLAGRLGADMFPVMPSLKGAGVLSVKQVKVYGFKLFNAAAKASGKNDIKDPDLKDIQVKSTIRNNILTIERTRMRVAGFRPRVEGQVSLDGKLNLKFRLGLPPLGIFGIPMTVTGTKDNPIIKLKRDKSGNVLQETADETEQ
jgi:AsmA protein